MSQSSSPFPPTPPSTEPRSNWIVKHQALAVVLVVSVMVIVAAVLASFREQPPGVVQAVPDPTPTVEATDTPLPPTPAPSLSQAEIEGCAIIMPKYLQSVPLENPDEQAIEQFVNRAAAELGQDSRDVAAFLHKCVAFTIYELERGR